MYRAVQYGYYDRVIELIDADPQLAVTPLNDNITLLHWAAINNRIEIAKYLINKGAKIDATGGALNSTPLHWAIRDGKLEMVILLLSYNAQPSLVDGEGKLIINKLNPKYFSLSYKLGCSGLHLASMFGHTPIVAYLITKGQDVDLPDTFGLTPLMHAALRMKKYAEISLRIQQNKDLFL
jgi:ankyrin repeat protein